MTYTDAWERLTRRMGYWIDMKDPYVTYDNKYIETLWHLLAELYKKGLLYKGYTIQPYSPAAGTGLSNHELNQPGCYRDVKDTPCVAIGGATGPTATGTSGQGRRRRGRCLRTRRWPWGLLSATCACGRSIPIRALRLPSFWL